MHSTADDNHKTQRESIVKKEIRFGKNEKIMHIYDSRQFRHKSLRKSDAD